VLLSERVTWLTCLLCGCANPHTASQCVCVFACVCGVCVAVCVFVCVCGEVSRAT